MIATAPRPVARLALAVGRETVDGATLVFTECCSLGLTHAIDQSPPGDGDPMDLSAFFDEEGDQVTRCRCGLALPDARRWRP